MKEDAEKLATKVPALEKGMENELEQLEKEHGSSHNDASGECNTCKGVLGTYSSQPPKILFS